MDKDLRTVVIYDRSCKYLNKKWRQHIIVENSRVRPSVLLDVDDFTGNSYLYANSLLKNTMLLRLEECWPEFAMCYFCKTNGILLGFYAERTGDFSYVNYLKHQQLKSYLLLECKRALLMPIHLWKESREELLTLQPVNLLTNNWLQVMSWWKRINIKTVSNEPRRKQNNLATSGISLKSLTGTVRKIIFLSDEQQKREELNWGNMSRSPIYNSQNLQTTKNQLVSSWWKRFFRQTEELAISLTHMAISFVTALSVTRAIGLEDLQDNIRCSLQNYFKKMGLDRRKSKGAIEFVIHKITEEAFDILSKLYQPIDAIITFENMEKYTTDNCLILYAYETVNLFLFNTTNLLTVSSLTTIFDSKNVNQTAVETVMESMDAISKDAKVWVEKTLQEGYYYLGYLKRQLLDARDEHTTNCAKLVSSILSALDVIVRDKSATDFRNTFTTYNIYAVIMFNIAKVCSRRNLGPSWFSEGMLLEYRQRLYDIMLSLLNELMAFLDCELNLHAHIEYQLSKSHPLDLKK